MKYLKHTKYTFYKLAMLSIAILFSLVWISGCSDDDDGGNPPVPDPTITSISPTSGQIGNQVTINGTNFSTVIAENTVTFNDVTADISSATATRIVTTVPANATTGPVKVTVNGKSVTGPVFEVIEPEPNTPTIVSIEPLSGPVGTEVTIKGTNFGSSVEENKVFFNETEAAISSANETTLVTPVPDGATTGPVMVIVNGDTVIGAEFEVLLEPAITSIEPDSGAVGTEVTIIGENFVTTPEDNKVTFNGVEATVSSATDSSLVATVPEGATTGPVAVEVNGLTATGPDFTVIGLTINSINPQDGPAGTEVTIKGAGFSENIEDNTVTFNGVEAEVKTASSDSLTVIVPDGATTGPVVVEVDGVTATGPDFMITAGLTIISIDPTSGPVGTPVLINGSLFSAVKEENTVTFNGIEATIISSTETAIVTTVPEGATTGPVQVIVADDTATGPDFEVIIETTVSTFAGGSGAFVEPFDLAMDAVGNVFVTDRLDRRVKKVTPDGTVTTFAGGDCTRGDQADTCYMDAVGTEARFFEPSGIDFTSDGNLYVSDNQNQRVRMIKPDATVVTIAGDGKRGVVNGKGMEARFSSPFGLFVNSGDQIFVTDFRGHTVRMVTKDSVVTTYAGKANTAGTQDGNRLTDATFNGPVFMTEDSDGNLYVAGFDSGLIRKISGNEVTTFAGTNGEFSNPAGMVVDANGNLYVADRGKNQIFMVTSNGNVSVLAGTGDKSSSDGNGLDATFNEPNGMIIDNSGNLLVTEFGSRKIRKITFD